MKIAVCCSSINDIDNKYKESSRKLLEHIFKEDNDLVFGAMDSGIMGIAYRTAKKFGRKVIGITPEIFKRDLNELECDTEIITKSINSRTEAMIDNSDALLFLPGGIGTLYELITSLEMKRSNEFDKPVIIYNETGFFDEMLVMLDKFYKENFTSEKVKYNYEIVNNYMEVTKYINTKENEYGYKGRRNHF